MECAVAMDWIVDEKKLLKLVKKMSNRSYNDEALDSPYVPTSFIDCGYCIRIFVNETNGYNSKEKYVSFYLSLNEEYLIDANVTLSIASANFCDNFTSESRETNLISHESFFDPKNGYFQNGKLTVQLRGSLTYIIRKTHEIKPIKNVGEILWKSDGKDFTIELDDGEIKAHKFVLRERSPYFAGMFNSGMKESRENKVAIEGFPFKIVEAAIKICYDCEISNTFSVDDYLFLLKFSDLYDIEHVKTFVERFLADVISRAV